MMLATNFGIWWLNKFSLWKSNEEKWKNFNLDLWEFNELWRKILKVDESLLLEKICWLGRARLAKYTSSLIDHHSPKVLAKKWTVLLLKKEANNFEKEHLLRDKKAFFRNTGVFTDSSFFLSCHFLGDWELTLRRSQWKMSLLKSKKKNSTVLRVKMMLNLSVQTCQTHLSNFVVAKLSKKICE